MLRHAIGNVDPAEPVQRSLTFEGRVKGQHATERVCCAGPIGATRSFDYGFEAPNPPSKALQATCISNPKRKTRDWERLADIRDRSGSPHAPVIRSLSRGHA